MPAGLNPRTQGLLGARRIGFAVNPRARPVRTSTKSDVRRSGRCDRGWSLKARMQGCDRVVSADHQRHGTALKGSWDRALAVAMALAAFGVDVSGVAGIVRCGLGPSAGSGIVLVVRRRRHGER